MDRFPYIYWITFQIDVDGYPPESNPALAGKCGEIRIYLDEHPSFSKFFFTV
jgi:hypothetical protein